MTGRVIIVTGGSSGIGFEVCKYLAEGGNDVILACRSKEKGNDAVHRIKLLYPNALLQFMQVSMHILFIKCSLLQMNAHDVHHVYCVVHKGGRVLTGDCLSSVKLT